MQRFYINLSSYLLLLDANAFIKSEGTHQVVTEILNLKDLNMEPETLISMHTILDNYGLSEDSIFVLEELALLFTKKDESRENDNWLLKVRFE